MAAFVGQHPALDQRPVALVEGVPEVQPRHHQPTGQTGPPGIADARADQRGVGVAWPMVLGQRILMFWFCEVALQRIWALEVANVVARAEAKGLIAEASTAAFVGHLNQMAIDTDPDTAAHALVNTLQLARRFKLPVYDAAYLELALRRGLPLATLDNDLQQATKAAGAQRV
jgi:predicted nucleic acid-binding protein